LMLRPALCAHSCAKLAAIGACREDVVQISLTFIQTPERKIG
jgi:hypothetical protein